MKNNSVDRYVEKFLNNLNPDIENMTVPDEQIDDFTEKLYKHLIKIVDNCEKPKDTAEIELGNDIKFQVGLLPNECITEENKLRVTIRIHVIIPHKNNRNQCIMVSPTRFFSYCFDFEYLDNGDDKNEV